MASFDKKYQFKAVLGNEEQESILAVGAGWVQVKSNNSR
jgi:hypothetical protein